MEAHRYAAAVLYARTVQKDPNVTIAMIPVPDPAGVRSIPPRVVRERVVDLLAEALLYKHAKGRK